MVNKKNEIPKERYKKKIKKILTIESLKNNKIDTSQNALIKYIEEQFLDDIEKIVETQEYDAIFKELILNESFFLVNSERFCNENIIEINENEEGEKEIIMGPLAEEFEQIVFEKVVDKITDETEIVYKRILEEISEKKESSIMDQEVVDFLKDLPFFEMDEGADELIKKKNLNRFKNTLIGKFLLLLKKGIKKFLERLHL